ncbi:MAG: sigma 54-interacting transcriptional regulator [Hyphomicrobiaceae bacterium]
MAPFREPEIIIGSSSQREILGRLERIARTDAEILITGPTGVGKELYAAYAHARSRRSTGPFVVANCSNLGSDLLENEVFGHARGAYTGAHAAGEGLAARAEGGTLFLDEVDALPLVSQAKLLRFIQQREYRRLGEPHPRRANIRFVAACNADLTTLVREGHFRSDLFFRLRVAPVAIPPLAERRDDIPPLVEYFLVRSAEEYSVTPACLSSATRDCLLAHDWPGNVRELENCLRYVTCLQLDREVEPEDMLPCGLGALRVSAEPASLREAKGRLVENFERDYLVDALRRASGNVAEAARQSGKHRRAFFELMRKHGMTGGQAV